MKKIKNNKGVTGIDVATSITLIIIALGIVVSLYMAYNKKVKEINRNTKATNLGIRAVQTVDKIDYLEILYMIGMINGKSLNSIALGDVATESEIDDGSEDETDSEVDALQENIYKFLTEAVGMNEEDLKNYIISIRVKQQDDNENLLAQLFFLKLEISVKYKINNVEKEVSFLVNKNISGSKNISKPLINVIYNNAENGEQILKKHYISIDENDKEVIPIRYDRNKNGYVETSIEDSDWYSSDAKIYPLVYCGDYTKDINGIITPVSDGEAEPKYYVWIPYYKSLYGTKYFCDENGHFIVYSEIKISGQDNEESEKEYISGYTVLNTLMANLIGVTEEYEEIVANSQGNSTEGGYWKEVDMSEDIDEMGRLVSNDEVLEVTNLTYSENN